MALQVSRFLVILACGPTLARLVARSASPVRGRTVEGADAPTDISVKERS